MNVISNNQMPYTRNKTCFCKLSSHIDDCKCLFKIYMHYDSLSFLGCFRTPKELHKWIKIMLDAYHLNQEETEIREAKKMNQPVVIQRLFILKETIEEEYLEQNSKTEMDVNSEEQ